MMRIAMIAGPIAYTVALCKALAPRCRIDLYCGKRYAAGEDPEIFRTLPENVRPVFYDEYRKRDPRNILAQYRFSRMLRRGNYDLIHFQYEGELPAMLFYRFWRRTPLVFTVHDPYQHFGYSRFLIWYMDIMQSFLINRSSRLVVHGNTMKNKLLQRYIHVKQEIVVSHLHGDPSVARRDSSVDITRFPEKPVVLFFGNIRPNKGLPVLIRAESLIARQVPGVTFHIVGRCADDSYKKLIVDRDRYSIREEFVPHDSVPAIFCGASVVVLPYRSATQTGVIPLAYAYGRPVVATTVGGLVDVVEDGKTGFLVPPADEKALGEAIVKILLDPALCSTMGRNGRTFLDEELSWEKAAGITMEMYESIVEEERKKT